ncbi:MAG: hypothetical protein ABEJ03_03320 [Candidatus Nanohaloarchaea archaeon]
MKDVGVALKVLAVLLVVLAPAAGFFMTQNSGPTGGSYCRALESNLRDSGNFSGPVACSAADEGEGNSSVAEKTTLVCSCRTVVDGDERVFNVRKASR